MAEIKPISLQMYSLREASVKDFPGVLKRVAAIGYKGVEPAGLYGMTLQELRKMVNDLGMVISSSHTPWATAAPVQEIIDASGVLGTKLMCGGFGAKEFENEDSIRKTAELVTEKAAALAKAGVTLLLHNHWCEFEKTPDGQLKYDIFVKYCTNVKFELDTYWATNFGANNGPEMVAKFAKRAPLLHIKDGNFERNAKLMAVGSGKNDIAGIVHAADPSVLKWLVVEADTYEGDMFDCVEQSYNYLVKQGLGVGNKK